LHYLYYKQIIIALLRILLYNEGINQKGSGHVLTDDIIITIQEDDRGLTAASDAAGYIGGQYDNEVQRLVFVRPEAYAGADLILCFQPKGGEVIRINIGKDNEYTLTSELTAACELGLQLVFIEDGTEMKHSSKIYFSLRPSIGENAPSGPPLPQQVRELCETAFVQAEYGSGALTFTTSAGNQSSVPLEGSGWLPGPAGPQGEKGEPGEPGEDGHSPYIGENGSWYGWDGGAYADTGVQAQGEQGPAGAKGEPGPQGEPGPKGEKGEPGDGSAADTGFFLPDVLYATVGNPVELYKNQIFRAMNRSNYEIYIDLPAGRNYKRKWSFTPAPEHVPSVDITVEVRDVSGNVIRSRQVKVMVSPAPPSASRKTIMLIGDSISTSGTSAYLHPAIREYAKAFAGTESDVLEMAGTKGVEPNKHEAVSGKSIEYFLSDNEANSFWDSAAGRTNFAAYSERTGITPDIVHLMLGTNNAFPASPDDLTRIEADADNFARLVGYLRGDWPDTKVIAGLIPYMGNQDMAEESRVQNVRLRQFAYDKAVQLYASAIYGRITDQFGADENIVIIPYTVLLDREYGYGFQTVKANPYSDADVLIPADFLHPQQAGQRQMAACIVNAWAYLMMKDTPGVTIANMLTNPGFNGTSGWNNMQSGLYDMSASNNVIMAAGKSGASGTGSTLLQNARPYVLDHKMYIRVRHRTNEAGLENLYSRGIQFGGSILAFNTQRTTDWVTVSAVLPVTTAQVNNPYFALTATISAARDLTGTVFESTEPLLVDLTAAFGEGNEPDKAWCDGNIPFFVGTMEIGG